MPGQVSSKRTFCSRVTARRTFASSRSTILPLEDGARPELLHHRELSVDHRAPALEQVPVRHVLARPPQVFLEQEALATPGLPSRHLVREGKAANPSRVRTAGSSFRAWWMNRSRPSWASRKTAYSSGVRCTDRVPPVVCGDALPRRGVAILLRGAAGPGRAGRLVQSQPDCVGLLEEAANLLEEQDPPAGLVPEALATPAAHTRRATPERLVRPAASADRADATHRLRAATTRPGPR